VLVVDGWEALAESLEQVDHGRGLDELLTLVRDGEQAGVRLVVAGGRGVLLSRLGALVGERLLLRPTDPTDLLLAGVPSTVGPPRQPPGRAIHLPSGHEVQLVWPGDSASRDQQALEAAGPSISACDPSGSAGKPSGQEPIRLKPLPSRVRLSHLPSAALPDRSIVLGVGGDEARPVVLDLRTHRRVLVCGPAGSGRTQALTTIAHQLHEQGQKVVALASGEGGLSGGLSGGHWPALSPDAPTADIAAALEGLSDDGCLLVDDVEDVGRDARLAAAIDHLVVGGRGCSVVWVARQGALRGPSSALVAAAQRHRTGLLLQPRTPHDGEPFGVLAEPVDQHLPGRGLLVVRGSLSQLQVAC
jgi:S-DNA-T family DNA segregation ATPase FtsK/SpoIIIE